MIDLTQLAKADIHRHLEGSIRVSTAWDLARTNNQISESMSLADFAARLEIRSPVPLLEALDRFDLFRRPVVGHDAVARITRESIEDAVADHVDALELRFSPFTLARSAGLDVAGVYAAVADGVAQGRARTAIARLGVVVVVSRRRGLDAAWEVVRAVERYGLGFISGLDLASDELRFRTSAFADVARAAVDLGLPLTVHTGEGADAGHVAEALALPGVRRLGHALSIVDDPGLVAEARDRGVVIEVCPTSNVRAGVVASYADHPVTKMRAGGLAVALCSDDPALFGIDLSHEFAVARAHLGFQDADLVASNDVARAALFDAAIPRTHHPNLPRPGTR